MEYNNCTPPPIVCQDSYIVESKAEVGMSVVGRTCGACNQDEGGLLS